MSELLYKLYDFPTHQTFHCYAPNKRKAFEFLSYLAKKARIPVYSRIIRYFDNRLEYCLFDSMDDDDDDIKDVEFNLIY